MNDKCKLEEFGDGRYGCSLCNKSFESHPERCIKGFSLPWPVKSVEEAILDEYRNIIKASRDYIEAMQSLHGPDCAGLGLKIINRIDKVL